MENIKTTVTPMGAFRKLSPYLATTATVALLAFAANSLPGNARGDSRDREREAAELRDIYQKVQLAELHQLEQAFHHAGSYGGNLDEMMALWAENSTLTAGTSTFSGKDAIRGFFAAAGPFQHYWVGLTKAFVFTADINGDTAELSFQCDYVDPSVTPAAVRVNSILSGTVKKVRGQWLFWEMNAAPTTL
jgi:hypothetical protein